MPIISVKNIIVEINRNNVNIGVNIRFPIGVITEIGRPHNINIGNDTKLTKNCSSKKLIR